MEKSTTNTLYEFSPELGRNIAEAGLTTTEFATILLAKTDGRILFFSIATGFTTSALGAEGLAGPVEMHIGNGYMPDHGALALQLLRDFPALRATFAHRFGPRMQGWAI